MSGECDRCGHHCMDCVCDAPNRPPRALEFLSQIDAELTAAYAEIARVTAALAAERAGRWAVIEKAASAVTEADKACLGAHGAREYIRALNPDAAAALAAHDKALVERWREVANDSVAALVECKRELWRGANGHWTIEDFRGWAIVRQINAALDKSHNLLNEVKP